MKDKNYIFLNSQKIPFQKKYSKRAKSIRISIQNGKLILTIPKAPFFQSQESLDKKALDFLESKKSWILKHISKTPLLTKEGLGGGSREHYLKHREQARILCEKKCEFWAEKMGVEYNRIAIKSMKTKWGSCSSKKNLNFNYKIVFLDEEKKNYFVIYYF